MMTFGEMVFWHASRQPDKPAVMGPGVVMTYGGLRDAIAACALRLQRLGWAPGGTVGILVNGRLGHLIVAAAVARLGFVTLSARDWRDLQESGVPLAGVVSGQPAPAGNTIPFVQLDSTWLNGEPGKGAPPLVKRDPRAVHHIALTSGSTGHPKPIGFDAFAIREIQVSMAFVGDAIAWDRLLCMPGPSAYFGYAVATMALVFGKTLVFGESLAECLNLAALYRAEFVVASNVQLDGILKQLAKQPMALPDLRMVYFGGSLVTQSLLQAAQAHLPAQIVCGYGSTENGVVAVCPGERVPRRDGATGYLAPWVTIEIVDSKGAALPMGQEGVIRLRTPSQGRVFQPASGTFQELDPESGWFYPGDLGLVQPDGMLIITGRADEVINIGGVKFAPELLEQALLSHPDVAEAVVVSLPDASGLVETWVAVVTPTPVEDEALWRQCKERIPEVEVRHIVRLESLPKTALGKPARDEVRKILNSLRDPNAVNRS